MSMLKDSSELAEAARLFRDLFENQAAAGSNLTVAASEGEAASDRSSEQPLAPPPPDAAPPPPEAAPPPPETPAGMAGDPFPVEPEAIAGEYRDDRLEFELVAMCERGGFSGAVVSDTLGLPLAVHNSPVQTDSIAAFSSILGDALAKAGRFLGQPGAENISMHINDFSRYIKNRAMKIRDYFRAFWPGEARTS